ncbi:MAG: hypothetical protein ACT4O9_05885 [Blastocatellia bacterium]
MQTINQLNADDLDLNILNSIRTQFLYKEIEIIVVERDETEYLLSSPKDREELLQAVADVEAGRNLITPDQEQFR